MNRRAFLVSVLLLAGSGRRAFAEVSVTDIVLTEIERRLISRYYQSHYDLGVAYKEMGLVDEAIAEFQKALRGPANRVRTYEAIGQCFIEKGQNGMAATILGRALTEQGISDEQLVGVLYLLGRANEAQGKTDDALTYYQRVFIVDIGFHDVAERVDALENAAKVCAAGNRRDGAPGGTSPSSVSPNASTRRMASVRARATEICWPSTARTASSNPSKPPTRRKPAT